MAIAPDRRELNANSRMIIDATTPFAWKNHPLAGDIISTPERTRKILERWGWILEVGPAFKPALANGTTRMRS